MKILALEFYKNGRMKESFAFGGSLEKEKININKDYPASLQNYLIDTGKEVILVDTGLPVETPILKINLIKPYIWVKKLLILKKH